MNRPLSALCGIAALTLLTHCATPATGKTWRVDMPGVAHPSGETPQWWYRSGAARAAENGAMNGRAKNVILFLGDGMSLTTVAAARIFDGQRKGGPGEDNQLSWERFPATALSKTYNTDAQVPDSAGTMTAITTGVKTHMGAIGVSAGDHNDCAQSLDHRLLNWLELADSAGLSAGIVTTTRLTHATPAASWTHSPDRNWENDTQLPERAKAEGCRDIAQQFLDARYGRGPQVLMGGGRGNFMPTTQADPEEPGTVGARRDGHDLIAEWKVAHPGGAYVWNTQQFIAAQNAPALLGLFNYDHMQYEHDRPQDRGGEPSLAQMTVAAIDVLKKNSNGYVLMVEGGRIDHANHAGNAYRALTDTVALSEAVQAAIDATSAQDTLIIVTADHSHTMSFVGYPLRGNPILGKVRGSSGEDASNDYALDRQGLPYTTLSYANGPGHTGAGDRPNLRNVDTQAPNYLQEALVPTGSETHGGDDVGIWARGPGSDAFRGTLEQNTIYHVIVQATPKLRARLCAANTCNAAGVPVELPKPEAFERGR
jgi:alkaline phosphatase